MDSRNLAFLDEQGMCTRIIDLHRERIQNWLQATSEGREFLPIKVIDTLRPDNGGMLARAPGQAEGKGDYTAFIPAAGASSRYYKALRQELKGSAPAALAEDLKGIALPGEVSQFLAGQLGYQEVEAAFDRPKALQLCTTDGCTFLEAKLRELDLLPAIGSSVFVVPAQRTALFTELLGGMTYSPTKATSFLEQGPNMSTLRFARDGKPYLDAEGNVSIVPGGHGTLKNLFKEVKEAHSASKGVLIANIDNVFGSNDEVMAAADSFLAAHRFVLRQVEAIRKTLASEDYKEANALAAELCQLIQPLPWERSILSAMAVDIKFQPLMECLVRCFHLSLDSFAAAKASEGSIPKAIAYLYRRPVNFLGQVKARGGEVGGTAVRAQTPIGQISLCLELPHFSEADHQTFLTDPAKATHFNPVFVAAELVDPSRHYPDEQNPFWLVAQKTFKGAPVIYHETILYEILGNSHFANVIFPEIPRSLFNPHKSYRDTKDRKLSDWFEA